MKKGLLILGTLVILGGAAGGGYWYYTQNYAPVPENAVYVSEVSSLTALNSGFVNRYAGVVEAQETVEVKIESGRKVKDVAVKNGDVVKKGQLLFIYDLTSIEEDLRMARLDLEKLKNEAASLQNQIATLEKDKKKAKQDAQLSYTIEIETTKMNLKKNEYEQISKQAEIDKLQNATGNTEVRSSIDGLIQKIDTSQMNSGDDDSVSDSMDDYGSYGYGYGESQDNAFIKILSTGEYRVKGSVNELNINFLNEGDEIIIRSRADETQTWKGYMGMIDRENANSSNNNAYYWGMSDAGDGETNSSTYPFYVELESSEGLMLGQHVYIEPDNGQMVSKTGVWLSEVYIVDIDSADPYVWAANEKNRLEKRHIVLGQYNEMLGEYEILEGLKKTDYLAYPEGKLEEGIPTTTDEALAADFGEEWSEDEWMEEEWPDEMGEFGDIGGFPEFEASNYGEMMDFGEMEEIEDFGEMEDFSEMEDLGEMEDMMPWDGSEEFEEMQPLYGMEEFDDAAFDEMEDMEALG